MASSPERFLSKETQREREQHRRLVKRLFQQTRMYRDQVSRVLDDKQIRIYRSGQTASRLWFNEQYEEGN